MFCTNWASSNPTSNAQRAPMEWSSSLFQSEALFKSLSSVTLLRQRSFIRPDKALRT